MGSKTRYILVLMLGLGVSLSGELARGQTRRVAPRLAQRNEPADVLPWDHATAAPAAPTPQAPAIVGEFEPSSDAVFGGPPLAVCETCGGGEGIPPRWSFQNDVTVLSRSLPKKTAFLSQIQQGYSLQTAPTSTTADPQYYYNVGDVVVRQLASTDSLEFMEAPMWQGTLTRYLGRDGDHRDHFLEFGYWGLGEWDKDMTYDAAPHPTYKPYKNYPNATPTYYTPADVISGTAPELLGWKGSLDSPFVANSTTPGQVVAAFDNALQYSADYSSNLNSVELNYRIQCRNRDDRQVLHPNGRWYRQCQNGFAYSYLFGLRSILFNEKLEFNTLAYDFDTDGALLPGSIRHGRYAIRTENTLLGFQIGGDLQYHLCEWEFDLHGKVGPYINYAEQRTHLQTNFPNAGVGFTNYDERWSAHDTTAALFGEFGVGASYKFRPRLVGHVSYDFMWMGEIALAPDQFTTNIPVGDLPFTGQIHSGGQLFFHGLTLGLECTW